MNRGNKQRGRKLVHLWVEQPATPTMGGGWTIRLTACGENVARRACTFTAANVTCEACKSVIRTVTP